jgi:tRNA(Ile)-lysidine synthase
VRAWLRELGLPSPAANTLASLLHDSRAAAADRIPVTHWPGANAYRYRGHLYALRDTERALRSGTCRPGEAFDLGSGQTLEWQRGRGRGLSRERLPETVEITHRASGERIQPAGEAHRRSLRKWLQERAIVPWQREAIPLVVVDGRVVAIADLACMQEFAARPDEDSWQLAWRGRPPLTPTEFQSVPGGGRST